MLAGGSVTDFESRAQAGTRTGSQRRRSPLTALRCPAPWPAETSGPADSHISTEKARKTGARCKLRARCRTAQRDAKLRCCRDVTQHRHAIKVRCKSALKKRHDCTARLHKTVAGHGSKHCSTRVIPFSPPPPPLPPPPPPEPRVATAITLTLKKPPGYGRRQQIVISNGHGRAVLCVA